MRHRGCTAGLVLSVDAMQAYLGAVYNEVSPSITWAGHRTSGQRHFHYFCQSNRAFTVTYETAGGDVGSGIVKTAQRFLGVGSCPR